MLRFGVVQANNKLGRASQYQHGNDTERTALEVTQTTYASSVDGFRGLPGAIRPNTE
jgi:hypothetical protein